MSSPTKTVSRARDKQPNINLEAAGPPRGENKSSVRSLKTAAPTTSPARRRAAQPAAPNASAAPPPASNAPKAKRENGEDFVVPIKEYVKPPNQLRLSDAELAEELACSLTASNPAAPSNIARFIPKDNAYKVEHSMEHMLQHYSAEGWLAYREPAHLSRSTSVRSQAQSMTKEMVEGGTDAHSETDTFRLHNQFNFNERAVQTTMYKPKDSETMTEPPPSQEAGGSTSQWQVFDAYKAHQERSRAAEDQAKARSAVSKRGAGGTPEDVPPAGQAAEESTEKNKQAVAHITQLVQRMCNQNMQQDIIADFKYWDDPADGIQEREGTLLPLWRFTAGTARGRHVTSLCWNPAYPDLFAAGYGSFDAQRQGKGAVVCFSLKDPSTPVFERQTDSGVMCLDFHPQQANIVAVGLYNGAVEILDVLHGPSEPLYRATAATGKHADAVTAVRWVSGASAGLRGLVFYSASADGRVLHWTLGKSTMTCQDFYELQDTPEVGKAVKPPAWNTVPLMTSPPYGATCMDFHQEQAHILLVGTEEGRVHRCSTALSGEAQSTYYGHSDPVYTVHWNRRHPEAFLSASADWTVKLWLSGRSEAVMDFDLGCPVGDAAWAPYSATVFAAADDEGRVQVFDLAANKTDPLSRQKIQAKGSLTKLAFNDHHPVLLVGDDRGCVHCLKLSPNLRRPGKTAGQGADSSVQQLDAIFTVALKSMATEEQRDRIMDELEMMNAVKQQALSNVPTKVAV